MTRTPRMLKSLRRMHGLPRNMFRKGRDGFKESGWKTNRIRWAKEGMKHASRWEGLSYFDPAGMHGDWNVVRSRLKKPLLNKGGKA